MAHRGRGRERAGTGAARDRRRASSSTARSALQQTISFPGPASDATAPKLGVGPGDVALVAYSFKNDRTPGGGVLVAAKRPSDDVGWIPQQQLSTVPATPLGVAVTADGTADVLYSQTGATADDTGVFLDRAALHQPFTTAKLQQQSASSPRSRMISPAYAVWPGAT